MPIDRIENNYYLKVLEAGDKLYTCEEIVEKWTWDEKDYYILHVNAVQLQIDKIHGDAIGGKVIVLLLLLRNPLEFQYMIKI